MEVIRRPIKVGMDVAHLNFSRGSHEEHARILANLRRIPARLESCAHPAQSMLEAPQTGGGLALELSHCAYGNCSGWRTCLAPM